MIILVVNTLLPPRARTYRLCFADQDEADIGEFDRVQYFISALTLFQTRNHPKLSRAQRLGLWLGLVAFVCTNLNKL